MLIWIKKQHMSVSYTHLYSRELLYHDKFKESIDEFIKFLNMDNGFLENQIDALRMMSYCYKKLGQKKKEIDVLFKTFKYDTPRAEVCCDIGRCV